MRARIIAILTVTLASGCSTSPPEVSQRSQAAAQPELLTVTTIPGFNHTMATTKFQIGAPVSSGVVESGFTKWIGSTGIFSVNSANGAAYGVMNGINAGGVPFSAYPGGVAAHEAAVQAYFTGAGLPADQVGGVHTNVGAKGSGLGGSPETPSTFAYSSTVTRSVNGFPVAESHAWARLGGSGNVVAESVYWPALDASVVADAVTLSNIIASPTLAASYLASIPVPSATSTGSIMIHHSSKFVTAGFYDVASYDVWFSPTEGSGWTRHFDKTGAEVRLPQELRAGHPVASRP